jgi:tetratricopeptide (TPR) repeat protein
LMRSSRISLNRMRSAHKIRRKAVPFPRDWIIMNQHTKTKTCFRRSITFAAPVLLWCFLSCATTGKTPAAIEPAMSLQETNHAPLEPETVNKDTETLEKSERLDRETYMNFMLASLNMIRGNYEEAREYLSVVIETDPDSVYLNRKMAILLQRLGDSTGAIKQAERCVEISPHDIDSHILLAELYFLSGDRESEQIEYETILELDPSQERIRLVLATTLIRKGLFNEAMVHLDELIKQNPGLVIAYYYRGRIHVETGDYEKAEKEYLHALELDDTTEPVLFDLASLYQMEKRFEEAAKLYRKLLILYPFNRAAKERLLGLYSRLGQEENMRKLIEDIERESEPGDPIRQTLGLYYLGQGRLAESIVELDLIVATWPRDYRSRYYLALAYEENGQPQKALEHYGMIPEETEFFVNSRIHMAYILDQMGEYDEAVNVLEKALVVDGEKVDLYLMLSSLFDAKKEYGKAMEVIEDGLKYQGKNTELLFRLGVMLDKAGDKEGSIEQMKKVLEIDPDHAESLNYIGYTYAEKGIKLDEALDLIQRALKIKPNSAYIIDSLGWVYYQKGFYDKALDFLKKAFSLLSHDPTIAEHLGDVYFKISEYEKSLEMYQKAITLETQFYDRIVEKIEDVKRFLEQ